MAEPAAPKKGDEFVALLSTELPAAVAVAKVRAGARGTCHARVRGRPCARTELRCPLAASAQRSARRCHITRAPTHPPTPPQAGNLGAALEKMLALEKRTRLAGDSAATSKVAVEIVRVCWELKDLEQLNAHILILSKRRAQLKQAVADVVKEAMGYVDAMPSREAKLALVTTLRTVADGKIYVEVRQGRRQRVARQPGRALVGPCSPTDSRANATQPPPLPPAPLAHTPHRWSARA